MRRLCSAPAPLSPPTSLFLLLLLPLIRPGQAWPAMLGRRQNWKDCADPLRQGCTCLDASMAQVNWTVTDFHYHARYQQPSLPPAHLEPPGPAPAQAPGDSMSPSSASSAFGYLGFNLTNLAAGYTTRCAASTSRAALGGDDDGGDDGPSSSSSSFFDGAEWYDCADADAKKNANPNAAARGTGVWAKGARFRYNAPERRLEVNQTWVCRDGGFPFTFQASGSTTTALRCNDTMWLGSDWEMGDGYSLRTVECLKTGFMVPWLTFMGK